MSTLLDRVTDLNDSILEGRALEAFEKYYHNDVVMQENTAEPTVGKDANRTREEAFFGNVTEFRGAKLLKVAIGENVSISEWHYDYTHKEWGVCNYDLVAVQEWKDGQIIHERFYYTL